MNTIQILNAARLTPEALGVMQQAAASHSIADVQRHLNAHLDYNRWAIERHGNVVLLVRVTRQHADDGEVVATIRAAVMSAPVLFAVFRMPHKNVATIVATESAAHSETLPVTVTRSNDDTITYVSGPAQSVMFVIGAVANHGWDTLAGVVTQ